MRQDYTAQASRKPRALGYAAGLVVAAGLGLAVVGVPTVALASDGATDSQLATQAVTSNDSGSVANTITASRADSGVSDGANAVVGNDAAADAGVTTSGLDGSTQGTSSSKGESPMEAPGDTGEGDSDDASKGAASELTPGAADSGEISGNKPSTGSESGEGSTPSTLDSATVEGGSADSAESAPNGVNAAGAEHAETTAPGSGSAASNDVVLNTASTAATREPSGHWDVSDRNNGFGLQRYWVWDDGTTAANQLITPGNGTGDKAWWAYATKYGFVVRGWYDAGNGVFYYADNDGKLWSEGWHVADLGSGLERYYVESDHAIREGYSTSGYAHYTTSSGKTLRGVYTTSSGKTYYADNDGRAAVSSWVVTNDLATGSGLQRYWFDAQGVMAKGRLVDASSTRDAGAGYNAWATANGSILRSVWDNNAGRVYLADNDGRLAQTSDGKDGWLVTGAYTNGVLQRYYIDSTLHAAKSGFFVVEGYGSIYGLGAKGYVLRGKSTWGSHMFLADNDGKLASSAGWLVTDKYDGTLQRYYLELVPGVGSYYGAKLGSFSDGADKYYGREDQGYVVRGRYVTPANVLIIADNDGKISYNLNGIDIASYQNGIDLSVVPADFVIIKATQGTSYTFNQFKKYADQALSLNKKLGFYHFVDTRVSAVSQADYFVNAVSDYIGKAVLFLDWENNDMNGQNNLSAGVDFAKAFLDRVYQRTGVKPLIYTSRAVVHDSSYDWSSVANAGYGLWVAQYPYKYYDETNGYHGFADNPGTMGYGSHSSTDYGAWGTKPTIWQYTSTGVLDGWKGQLDLNVFFGSSSDWDALAKRA